MSQIVKLNDKNYFISLKKCDNNLIKCLAFDFEHLFVESIGIDELIDREKGKNPMMEFDRNFIESTLNRKPDSYKIIECEEDSIQLENKYYVSGVPVKFTWNLKLANQKEFSQNLIFPLWRSLFQLEEDCKSLKQVIQNKDKEIDQYKIEGYKLKRRLLTTEKFDETKFNLKNQLNFSDLLSINDAREELKSILSGEPKTPIKTEPGESSKVVVQFSPVKKEVVESKPKTSKRRNEFCVNSDALAVLEPADVKKSKIRTELDL